jgi:hypothetical protein
MLGVAILRVDGFGGEQRGRGIHGRIVRIGRYRDKYR